MPDTKKTRERVRKANERIQKAKESEDGFVPEKLREELKAAIAEYDKAE